MEVGLILVSLDMRDPITVGTILGAPDVWKFSTSSRGTSRDAMHSVSGPLLVSLFTGEQELQKVFNSGICLNSDRDGNCRLRYIPELITAF